MEAGAAAAAGVALLFVEWWVGVTLLWVGIVVAAFAKVTVAADGDGVHVASGVWPLPRLTIRLDRIESIEAIDVNPWRWGGWGYRGALRMFKRAAWIVRAGPGLKLSLTGGRTFVVTVDDAAEGAAALQGRARA